MRHGLSCSNVLDGCMTHIENVDQAFQPHIFDAIDRELVDTPFDRAVGYGAAEVKGDDCTLVLEWPDQTTAKVRLHDAYRDPKLTDCGVELSKRAGVALRRRYAKPALVMSSTLMTYGLRQGLELLMGLPQTLPSSQKRVFNTRTGS